MKLVLLVHEFPKASEAFLVDKFCGLHARGVDVHLVAERENERAWALFPTLDQNAALRARVHIWPTRSQPLALCVTAIRELARTLPRQPRRVIKALRLALRHTASESPARFLFSVLLLRLDPDILHFEFGSLAADRVDLLGWISRHSTVSFRGWDLNFFSLDAPERLRAVFDRADRIHFVSKDLRERAERRNLLGGAKNAVIRPAVDMAHFNPSHTSKPTGQPSNRPLRVIAVGRLHWKKGYEFALEAIRRVLDAGTCVKFKIIGEGPFEDAVRRCVEDFHLTENVELQGVMSRAQVKSELMNSDVFLHAAVSEGFCNGVLEAQAMGLPVVCTDADGLRENIEDGVTGTLVPRRDAKALAREILRLANDPELFGRIAMAGPARVRAQFDPARQIDAFMRFYDDTLNRA